MKILKHISVVILLIIMSLLYVNYLEPDSPAMITFIIITYSFFAFNFFIRKSLLYKNYFLSKYNLFTTKFRTEKSFDIPKELMFEKIIEVINDSRFKLAEVDKDKLEILAISIITFRSWGENLYINFETKGDKTIIKFSTSTLFQVYSWGKIEKNYDDLVIAIEDSLIV